MQDYLLDVAGQSGALTGTTRRPHPHYRVGTRVYQLSLFSGTATVVFEGRHSANDTWITINTLSTTDAFLGAVFPEVRARIVSATSATLRATVDALYSE